MPRDVFFAAPTSCIKANGSTTGKGRQHDQHEDRQRRRAGRCHRGRAAPAASGMATMRPRMASISVCETRPAATRDSELLDQARPACGSAALAHRAHERQRAAAIDDGADQVHDGVDEAPGEVAAEGGDEHVAQLRAPGLGHRHGAGEAERHEQAEQHLHDPVDRMEDRLAGDFGRGRGRTGVAGRIHGVLNPLSSPPRRMDQPRPCRPRQRRPAAPAQRRPPPARPAPASVGPSPGGMCGSWCAMPLWQSMQVFSLLAR